MEGRPKKFTDVKEMREAMEDYFIECDNQTKEIVNEKGQTKTILVPYTINGLCLHLNTNRETLSDYQEDIMFSATIKKAKMIIENWVESKSLTGDIPAVPALFNLKNNFGWKDKTEVETADVSKDKYESWLKDNEKILNVTPEVKTLEG